MGSRKSTAMSYRGSGSRYPSAYGHTPSYRSVNTLPSGVSTSYETPTSSFTSGLGRDMARDLKFDIDRELKAFDTPLTTSSGLGGSSSASRRSAATLPAVTLAA